MEELEHGGAVFQDKHRDDIRVQFIAPVAACVLMVLLMFGMMFLMGWAFATEPQDAPPVPVMILFMGTPVLVIIGVVLALFQRIREIGKGEIDDARKY